jgi:hypothetical protein
MTTAEDFHSAVASRPTAREVSIAGVPWPVYKLVALAVGFLVLAVVGLITMTTGPAVLGGAAAAAAIWVTAGHRHPSR